MHSVLHAFTHSVVWASVLASVFVAAVTTLLVEYLAKPWLEVRKDRILEANREQRTAIRDIRRASFLARTLYISVYIMPENIDTFKLKPGWEVNLILERVDKMAAEIAELAQKAAEIIGVRPYFLDEWIKTIATISSFSTVVHAGREPSDDAWEDFNIAAETLNDYAELFTSSVWHLLRRFKLIMKIKSSPISQISLGYDPRKENNSRPE